MIINDLVWKVCPLCNKRKAKSRHHLTPRSEGGSDEEKNIAMICQTCHQFIHRVISNFDLGKYFYTLDKIYDTPEYQEFIVGTYVPSLDQYGHSQSDRWAKNCATWYEIQTKIRKRKIRRMMSHLINQ